MSFYLISYDLNAPGQDYTKIIKKIKEIADGYCKPLESTWIIGYNGTATDVYNILSKQIDKTDRLLIMEATKNYAGYLNQDVIDWMKKHIG